MTRIWEKNRLYHVLRPYVDFMTRTSFRSVIIKGKENIRLNDAVLYVPNHSSGLMDPMLVLMSSKIAKGFGARSDAFNKKFLVKILRFLKILPVARARNGMQALATNIESFNEIIDRLGHKLHFCLFAEGQQSLDGQVLPMRKRSFMLAKQAHDSFNIPVYIQPIGIKYEYQGREGGRAMIQFGEPFEIGEYFSKHQEDSENNIYKELCDEVYGRVVSLVQELPERNHSRIPLRSVLSIISLPVFIPCAILAAPIWIPAKITTNKIKEKAWTHTVHFGFYFALPIFAPFYWVYSKLLCKYQELLEDISK